MSNDKYLEERKEKLNIFQKIRLSLQERKRQISFEEYIKLPDYIKENTTIIRTLFRTNDLSEEQIEQIPEYQLINALGISNIAKKLSLPKRVEFIEKGYLNIRNNNISEEEKNEILEYTVIQNKQYSFIQNISGNWRDEQEFLKYLAKQRREASARALYSQFRGTKASKVCKQPFVHTRKALKLREDH